MKIVVLLCWMLQGGILLAQLPKGPGGKDLFQKGDCKVIISNLKYECEFCEDKELTKNCKKYDCSLTECKEQTSSVGNNTERAIVNIEGKQVRISNEVTKPAEKTDITSHFNAKKVKNGTVLVYESKGNGKVYGVYKKSKLQEWYVITNEGKKLYPSTSGLQATTCTACVIMPNGSVVCSSCTVTPGISDGIKTHN